MSIQKEIKEALEKVTPGEWYLEDDGDDELVVMATDPEVPGRSSSVFGFDPELYYSKEDAHLIANAPTWLLHQHELIEQKDAEIDSWKKEVEYRDLEIKRQIKHGLEKRRKIVKQEAEIARLRQALTSERDEALKWDGIGTASRINKVLKGADTCAP